LLWTLYTERVFIPIMRPDHVREAPGSNPSWKSVTVAKVFFVVFLSPSKWFRCSIPHWSWYSFIT